MSGNDAKEEHSGKPPAGRQYVFELIRELEGVSADLLRGRGRFPVKFELSQAPAQFRSVVAIAQRALRRWDEIPPEISNGIEESLKALLDIVTEIEAHEVVPENEMAPGARRVSGEIKRRLNGIQTFFGEAVEPLVGGGDDPAAPSLSPSEAENMRRTREELEESKNAIADLEARYSRIDADLESRQNLVDATRADAGAEGAKDLAEAYEDQAKEQERQWKYWGIGLLAAIAIALGAGYGVLELNHPDENATTAQLVSHVAIDLLIVGLLIYAVRVTSLQFSVHRHLAAVARNKAAALTTFSRIVSSGSSSETRDRLAEVLAHYVFISNDTGFLDSSSDQVTLPERLAAPVAQRINGASSASSAT